MKIRLSTKLLLGFFALVIISTIIAMKVAQTKAQNCSATTTVINNKNK